MRQRKNRFEDVSIIPLGIPLSQPYKSNGQITKYIHYAGSLNALEPKKEKSNLLNEKETQTEKQNPLKKRNHKITTFQVKDLTVYQQN